MSTFSYPFGPCSLRPATSAFLLPKTCQTPHPCLRPFAHVVPLLRTLLSHVFAQLPSPHPLGLGMMSPPSLPTHLTSFLPTSQLTLHYITVFFPFSEVIFLVGCFACVVSGSLPYDTLPQGQDFAAPSTLVPTMRWDLILSLQLCR